MAMEEQRTPPKAVRGGISKEDDDKRPRSQQNSAGKQTSAALYSPFKPVIKSMASPQLLWLPRLPNEESPLLINKIRGSAQAPPPLPPIKSLSAAAAVGPPQARPNFLNSLPLYERLYPSKSSTSSLRATKTTINPIWSAKSGQDGPFRAIFGGNMRPPSSRTTSSGAPPSQLPLALHHQSSFTFPPIAAPKKQSVRYRYRYDKIKNSDTDNKPEDGGGGEGPTSARPPHRRRKKTIVDVDGDLIYNDPSATTTTTSDEGSQGYLSRTRKIKKVRWAGGKV